VCSFFDRNDFVVARVTLGPSRAKIFSSTRARAGLNEAKMISSEEKAALKKSWKLVIPIAETAADLFYRRLFELKPEYRGLFPDDMTKQKRKLLRMLAFVVQAVDFDDSQWKEDVAVDEDLLLVVLAMGRRHLEIYRIPDESYGAVGEALLWALDFGLGDAFTPEVRSAWTQLYTSLARVMRMGATVVDTSGWQSTEAATEQGEAALLTQMAAAGIDDAKLGIQGERS
jgi:hemoglobin-like flavoprotein